MRTSIKVKFQRESAGLEKELVDGGDGSGNFYIRITPKVEIKTKLEESDLKSITEEIKKAMSKPIKVKI